MKYLQPEVEKLVGYVKRRKSSGQFKITRKGSPSGDPADKHIGAIIVDATLSARHNYEKQVKKRVVNIRTRYPQAVTTSGFLGLISKVDLEQLLMGWESRSKQKLKQIQVHETAQFFAQQQPKPIETFQDLANWIKYEKNRNLLIKRIKGICPKTADYYGVLVCDPDAVAIDERITIFLDNAGIDTNKYSYKEKKTIVQMAAKQIGCRPLDLEQSIWNSNPKKNDQKGKKMIKNTKGLTHINACSPSQLLPKGHSQEAAAIVDAVICATDAQACDPGKRREIRINKKPTGSLVCAGGPVDSSIVTHKYGAYMSTKGKGEVLIIPINLWIGTNIYTGELHYHTTKGDSWIPTDLYLNGRKVKLANALTQAGYDINRFNDGTWGQAVKLRVIGNEICIH